ncbi:MAG: hypothetical protein UV73_C0005G0052 [Candidatus Gottesmanbacteria bacterium GW2011_GWA2_43_14]|uniref:Uncharacterized protein n=1 Tax=Candidatus Gottesmanbacteria bacterium GW2011_GWA2_43_14 TaxID=1618443 RepID=A0A0G1DIV0_9BACT|nr:MAG: hypothetical protein UV73_C0005G0052 [Candidatus Gottesmanbacteria bacterium GW2011_GWA2_43_14]
MENKDIVKIAVMTAGAAVILGGSLYAAYRYSLAKQGDIVLPGGTTYLGATPTGRVQPSTPPLRFTADATVPYKEHSGAIYPFSFSFPETLPLVVFTNDPTDSVAIAWGNIPPQQNILLNMELIEIREKTMVNKPKQEYVENWWKYFSGLKNVASVVPFTNIFGLKGYKASYVNYANTAPNVDVFFEVPGRNDLMIHMANGILDAAIFDRIVDSLKWTAATPTP